MIKQAIMDYGAVFTSVRMYDENHNRLFASNSNMTYLYYNGTNKTCDHAVSIVGWDDNMEIPGAPDKGAWIMKNSWETGERIMVISMFHIMMYVALKLVLLMHVLQLS